MPSKSVALSKTMRGRGGGGGRARGEIGSDVIIMVVKQVNTGLIRCSWDQRQRFLIRIAYNNRWMAIGHE